VFLINRCLYSSGTVSYFYHFMMGHSPNLGSKHLPSLVSRPLIEDHVRSTIVNSFLLRPIPNNDFFFFFWLYGGLNWGCYILLVRHSTVWATYPALFALIVLEIGSHFLPRPAWPMILLYYDSCCSWNDRSVPPYQAFVTIIEMSHFAWAGLEPQYHVYCLLW
jgi:hypothetical protein